MTLDVIGLSSNGAVIHQWFVITRVSPLRGSCGVFSLYSGMSASAHAAMIKVQFR